MGLSVSRIILINEDILEIDKTKEGTAKWEVLEFIKRIPKGTHYKVTYTLDNRGPFVVVKRNIMVLVNTKTEEDMGCCFLPNSWDGRRVRRSVIVPIYESDLKPVV